MIARRMITALVVALVVSGLFTLWLSRKFTKPAAAVRQQQYVATATPLEAGEVIEPSNVKMIDWPAGTPIDGGFVKPADVVGRTLLYPLSDGEPIVERQLAAKGSIGLSTKIPDGMRAIALKSNEVVGVAGFMLPGTHVDVLVTYRQPNQTMPVTQIVLQDVQILTSGQKMQPDPDGKANMADVVTLLVKPEDAERVVLASAQGTVHFVLRNGTDHQHVIDQPMQIAAGMGNTTLPSSAPRPMPTHKAAGIAPVAPKRYVVATVNGTKQTLESF